MRKNKTGRCEVQLKSNVTRSKLSLLLVTQYRNNITAHPVPVLRNALD